MVRGGEKLNDKLNELASKIRKGGVVRIGFLEGATYPDGTLVALVAAVQEFGAPSRGIPPRPFFRNMIQKYSKEWPGAMRSLLKQNGYDVNLTLQLTGEAIAGQLRQSIRDTNYPPLAPATIARKGFDKPLIDTGHMFNSISYEVKIKQ